MLQLLALGQDINKFAPTSAPSSYFTHSTATIRWLEPGYVNLVNLYDLQPDLVTPLLTNLWQHLRSTGKIGPRELSSTSELLAEVGHWLIQPVDLTGNNQSEAILTLYEDPSGKVNQVGSVTAKENQAQYQKRTIIFSEAGTIIYSELAQNSSQSLQAIAELGDKGTPALTIKNGSDYLLKRWSKQSQRFE